MSCLDLTVTAFAPPVITVRTFASARLSASAAPAASLSVASGAGAILAADNVAPAPRLAIQTNTKAVLNVGAVCSVSAGEIYVLSTQEGPLRLRDGGYLLLDPKANSPG